MSNGISIWTLKKMPMQHVVRYIEENSGIEFQARMANMSHNNYGKLTSAQAQEQLATAISRMNEEQYTDYLLELIDE
ncbi:hypothetical protein [Paenibacillus apiarius]|uniref:hypothetical protein n=1 Tax=Paenibacillus apiarius TaxID=46240 RepID=UPI00197EF3E3|nr:hypothetical protein [Paenibacillus apiarius]MBN3527239.1 hypothetical protein [Paenibacillus apiarius]